MKQYQLFINGKWVDALSGKTFESLNPATKEVNAIVAEADREDVDLAVKAARHAFESGPWSDMAPSDRGRLLYKAAQVLWERADFLAETESRDNGLPIRFKEAPLPHRTTDLTIHSKNLLALLEPLYLGISL